MPPRTRRQETAAATRRAILDAAHALFAERGYFDTRVEQIAERAGVAPASVYAVGGGKRGILVTLVTDAGSEQSWEEHFRAIRESDDPRAAIDLIVVSSAEVFEAWAPLLRQLIAAAPREPTVRESLEIANSSMRRGFRVLAERLAELGALRDGVDADRATDVLYLLAGNSARFVRADDLGWTSQESVEWLRGALARELLGAET